MGNVRSKVVVEKVPDSVSDVIGYSYNARVLVSVDGGFSYYYCGNGKFFKSEEEAYNYANNY